MEGDDVSRRCFTGGTGAGINGRWRRRRREKEVAPPSAKKTKKKKKEAEAEAIKKARLQKKKEQGRKRQQRFNEKKKQTLETVQADVRANSRLLQNVNTDITELMELVVEIKHQVHPDSGSLHQQICDIQGQFNTMQRQLNFICDTLAQGMAMDTEGGNERVRGDGRFDSGGGGGGGNDDDDEYMHASHLYGCDEEEGIVYG